MRRWKHGAMIPLRVLRPPACGRGQCKSRRCRTLAMYRVPVTGRLSQRVALLPHRQRNCGRCPRRCSRAFAPSRFPGNFFAFPFSEVGLPHIFSKQLSDLWAIAVIAPMKKSSRGRFRVGLMTQIPARKNFKNTKSSKTSQISLEPGEKFSLIDFLPKV
jgi:hypothetical protein